MLILLDIDGVMVPATSWRKQEILDDGFPSFSNKASLALQKIIDETNADILLTTSHKSNYSIAEWQSILKLRGINSSKINSLPENTSMANRKDEILNWYTNNKSKDGFVILDDDKSLNDLPNFLKQKLVLTSPMIGLTNELALDAISILKKAEPIFAA